MEHPSAEEQPVYVVENILKQAFGRVKGSMYILSLKTSKTYYQSDNSPHIPPWQMYASR